MIRKRRKARELAVQVLYSFRQNPQPFEAIFQDPMFANAGEGERDFARQLIEGCIGQKKELDTIISQLSENWSIRRIAAIDHIILWMALFEMIHIDDIPPVVSMNEAIELAKKFSTEDSSRFINGILDHYHKSLAQE
jgi:N utilization substance protein B